MRALAALAVLLLSGSEVAAQPSPSAQQSFDSGLTLMAKHDYAAACAAFDASLRLDRQYGTALNLAICYAMIGKFHAAWKLYCEVARADPDRQRAQRAARAADELWPRLAKLRLHLADAASPERGAPGDLRVRIDDTDVTALLDSDIAVEDGAHRIDAASSGKRPFHAEITVGSGDRRVIELALEPEPEPVPAHVRTPEAPPQATSSPRRTWGWLTTASGGALVAGGLVAGWNAYRLDQDAHDACHTGRCDDPRAAQRFVDRARTWATVSTTTVLVGAAAIGGGVYLLHSARDRGVQLEIAVARGTGSLAVSGAF